ncbi:MAG: hypothetical protein HY996_12600 [Micrococcales bacterium]|nr:hypothetical protein [Micrococcales bacterium]
MTAPRITLARQLHAAGESAAALERRARRGTDIRVRRGVYASAEEWRASDQTGRHLARMASAQAMAAAPLTFSHASAALAHGIPLLGRIPEQVHVTGEPGGGRRSRAGVVWHEADLGADEVEPQGASMATVPWRTAFDLAACDGAAVGVVALDHVLRASGQPDRIRERVQDALDARRPFRGARRVDAVLRIATGLADTPLESLSLQRFDEHGLPRPLQQQRFWVDGHEYFADFYWRRWDMIGEADGRRKYEADAARDGRHPRDVLWAEKLREDALRTVVRRFVRWTWADALDGARLADRIRAAALR